MLSPKHRRYADRIKALIEESREIASLEKPSQYGGSYIQDEARLNAWLVKLKNVIEVTFGQDSPHHRQMLELTSQLIEHAYQVQSIEGLLIGALDDLEGGFLVGQEFLIAGRCLTQFWKRRNTLTRVDTKTLLLFLHESFLRMH